MSRSAHDRFLLEPTAAEALATRPIGPLLPVVTEIGAEAVFVALDDFDQSLRRSGRLLLETDGSVALMQADGSVLSQAGVCKGQPVSGLPTGPVKAALADLPPLRSLLPVGRGRMHRVTVAFQDDEGKSHARAKLLSLDATIGTAVTIATLQGLRGFPRALTDLRAQTLSCEGVPLSMNSLFLRLFPELAAYEAKPAVDLGANRAALEAACNIIAAYISVARANEGGIIADYDSEFLHDYRIALRKIRSVLSLFRGVYGPDQTAALKARFSAIMAPTGRLRDLDVILLERQTYRDLLPSSLHAGLDAMFALLVAEREDAKARLVRHLRSDIYVHEITSLEELFFGNRMALLPGPNAAQPARAFACSLVWKRYRKIRRIAGGIGPDSDDAEVHGLRIECKKLRYLMEFFAPLFPKGRVPVVV